MTDRRMMLGTLVAIFALTITVAGFQRGLLNPPPGDVSAQKIKDNLYMMTGGGGNSAVFITAEGVTVVDTKNEGWGPSLLKTIKTVTDKPIVRIINTHTHFDHVSGNIDFPANIDIVTHQNTKSYMDQGSLYPQPGQRTTFSAVGGKGLPTRTFTDTMTIGSGNDRIELRYFGRAHTGGDAFVIFPALRVMHVGDVFNTKDLPLIDTKNGGSGVEFPKTLANAAAAAKDIEIVINGHHPTTTTPAELRLHSEFLADFVQFVQAAKKSGKTLDDVATSWTLAAKYSGYAMPQPARVKADAEVIWEETK